MASWYSADQWLPSVERFLKAWSIVRICPEKINAPKEELSFNVLTLAISLAIFLLARTSVAGSNRDLGVVIVAMIVSVCIVFGTGYVTLILQRPEKGRENAPKWGAFFVMIWLTSLILLVLIDALPFWLGYQRTTTAIIDGLFGPAVLSAWMKDSIRAVFFAVPGLAVLAIKKTTFNLFERCALVTVGFGLLANTCLLALFIYGHLI